MADIIGIYDKELEKQAMQITEIFLDIANKENKTLEEVVEIYYNIIKNEKVCYNCKYKRGKGNNNKIYCWCNFTGRYLSYAEIMTGWCRHWSKDKGGGTK